MKKGNMLIILPFMLMLILASCQRLLYSQDAPRITAVMTHEDGVVTEYHDFSFFGNG